MHKIGKALSNYSAFVFNIYHSPVFPTVCKKKRNYILFLPLIFALEVGANKWRNDHDGGRHQARERGVYQEKPIK